VNYFYFSSQSYLQQYRPLVSRIDNVGGVFLQNEYGSLNVNGKLKVISIKVKDNLIFWESVLNYARIAKRLNDSNSFRERFNLFVKDERKLWSEYFEIFHTEYFIFKEVWKFLIKNRFSILVHVASKSQIIHNLLYFLKIRDSLFFQQLDQFKIEKIIFCYQGPQSETHLLIKYCTKRRIDLIFYQHNWDNLSSKELLHRFPDKLLVWSYQCFLHATSILRMPDNKVVIAGNPRLDEHIRNKIEYSKINGAQESKKVKKTLFFGDSSDLDELKFLKVLCKTLSNHYSSWICEYRPHPYLTKMKFTRQSCPINLLIDEQFENAYFEMEAGDWNIDFLNRLSSLDSARFVDKVMKAELIIVAGSTICLEVLLLGKPVIFINAKLGNQHVLDKTHLFGLNKVPGLFIINEENVTETNLLEAIKASINVRIDKKRLRYFYANINKPNFSSILESILTQHD
jgi:hypothetical protein